MISGCLLRSNVCIFLLTRIKLKIMSKNFYIPYFGGDSAKLSNSYRFHNGNRNIIVNSSERKVFFSKKVAKKCLYKLKISRNININYFFHFKSIFSRTTGIFRRNCLSVFNLLSEISFDVHKSATILCLLY